VGGWEGGRVGGGVGRGVRVRVNGDLVCYMMPMENALTADGLTSQVRYASLKMMRICRNPSFAVLLFHYKCSLEVTNTAPEDTNAAPKDP